jgi:hypothetical protein
MTLSRPLGRLKSCPQARIPHWLLLSLVLLTAAGVAGLVWWNQPLPDPPDPLYEKYTRLRVGMTEEELQEVLGSRGVEPKPQE